ncbi:UbiA prenyltransferase [Dentipellis sp. KUC8613]|nr:UbiA prenyltransferase [Dentipellis sp. KUC8613]
MGMATPKLFTLLSLPTCTELQACLELCRLSLAYNFTGFWAIWAPTAWSVLMAYHVQDGISILAVLRCLGQYIPLCVGIQSLMMTIDDIMDHDIDILVSRTRTRPIPRGAISLPRAWLFFSIQAAIGVYCANVFLSATSFYLSMSTWPILFSYPTLKRWTSIAPIPLGVVFNIGTCMGWSDISMRPQMSWGTVFPLYVAACLWTICYETIYQHQDRADDEKIGIYSMARLFGTATIPLCGAAGVGFFAILAYLGVRYQFELPFFFSISFATGLVVHRLSRTNIDSPESCRTFFLGMPFISQVVIAGLASDAIHYRLLRGIPL